MSSATIARKAQPTATIARKARPTATIARGETVSLVRDGIVAEYRFDDGSGQVLNDYSVNGYDGTLGSTSGSDTNDPTWVTEGLSFDGTDDYVDLPTGVQSDVAGGTACTVLFVLLAHSPAATEYLYHVGSQLDIQFNTSRQLRFGLNTDSFSVLTQTGSLTAGTWYVAQIWYDGATHGIDVNDDNVGSTAKSGTIGGSGAPRIGAIAGGAGSAFWSDRAAYAIVYDRYLTEAERAQNYQALRRIMSKRGVSL